MRLKHLELQGYKSFANRTEFLFDEQITAIVGPNGVGKSNIADALRWALGEQSFTTLRAKRTQDMIFAGSDGRPRQGMAEVTLILDNADGALPIEFTEVTLTRRAYRSGESENFLNGARVRLRDILDLLGAAGLSRSRYLVIGQGLVDAALALRPNQRRELVDEAAGIRPYQLKRENALAKLAETQANMVRVNDILSELTPRLRRLEQHAERAYEHARLSQELEELLGTWHGYQWHRAQEQLREANTRRQGVRQLITRYETELRDLNERVLECRGEREAQRQHLANLRREAVRLRGQYEDTRRSLAVRRERERLLTGQRDELEREVTALRAQIEAVQTEIVEVEDSLRRLEEEQVRRTSQLEQRRAAVRDIEVKRETLQERVTSAQARLMDLASRLADRRGHLSHLEKRQAELRRAVEEGRRVVAELEGQRASTQDALRPAEARQTQAQDELATLESQVAGLGARRQEAQTHAEQRQTEWSQTVETLRRLTTRRDALAEVRARTMAADTAAQDVLQTHRGRRLVDLLQVRPEMEPAVEAALGDRLWSVVVESQAQVMRALQELWAAGAGRVSFLPLDALRPPTPGSRPQADQPGVLGRLSDLVGCDDRFRPAVEALLGTTLLVEDLATALRLQQEHPGVRFVTLRGEVLEPSGMMTGGATQAGGGLLAQEREWRELAQQIQETEATQETQEAAAVAAAERAAALDAELTALEERQRHLAAALQEAQEHTAALRGRIEQLDKELAWRRSRLEESRAELASVISEAEAHQAGLTTDEPAHASCLTDLQALQEEWTQLQEGRLLRELAAAETATALTAQELETGRISLAAHRRTFSQLEEQLSTRVQRLEAVTGELGSLAQEIEALDGEQAKLFEELTAQESQIQPAEAALDELRARESRLEEEASQVRERLHQAEASEMEATGEVSRWEERLVHLKAEIAADVELLAMREDHPLQLALDLPTDLSPLPTVTVIPEGLERQVQDLKRGLRALGPVDPETVAEYETTSERYTFLSEQMADLHKAAEDLSQVIAELDQIMTRRFNETLAAVSEAFSRYFTALFGGGSARLVRVEGERPEELGVEIVARPPGKRPQPLALLSGGERALTAVALIFALLEVSKTPFCLLDEVDAMLDEANIGRFRQALQTLAQHVQFILITHNRGTIEAAHTVYGVSMSHEGVSQVISLKLEEAIR